MSTYGRSLKRLFSPQRAPFNSTARTRALTIQNPKFSSPAIFITKVSSSSVGSTPWQNRCLFRCVMVLWCLQGLLSQVKNLRNQDFLGSETKLNLKRNTQNMDFYHFCPSPYQLHCKISSTTSEVNRNTRPSRHTPKWSQDFNRNSPTALLSCFSKLRTSTRSKEPLPLSLKLSVGALQGVQHPVPWLIGKMMENPKYYKYSYIVQYSSIFGTSKH